jgi:hypothetical protein
MTANAVIAGTFADLRSVKSRSVVVLHIEVPIERAADVVAMFGYPQPGEEVSVAVARLLPAAADPAPATATSKPKRPWDDLSLAQQAGIACGDPDFWVWLDHSRAAANVFDVDSAAQEVRYRCNVKSRREFDRDEAAARRWNALHGEFKRWRADRAGQEQAEAQAAAYGRT